MATLKDLEYLLDKFPEQIIDDATDILEETAVQYYKESFSRKAFDGTPWKPTDKSTGSTLVESGNLMNSITTLRIARGHVRASAGNSEVPYAKGHNEGFKGTVNVKPFTRKGKPVEEHTRQANTPRRQYMGDAKEMRLLFSTRFKQYLKTIRIK